MAETTILDATVGATDSVSRSRTFSVGDDLAAQEAFKQGDPFFVVVRMKSTDFTTNPDVRLALWLDRSTDGGRTWEHYLSATAIGGTQRGRVDTAPQPTIGRAWDGLASEFRVLLAQTAQCDIAITINIEQNGVIRSR